MAIIIMYIIMYIMYIMYIIMYITIVSIIMNQVMEETGLEFELSTLFLVETAQGSWYR